MDAKASLKLASPTNMAEFAIILLGRILSPAARQ